MSWTLPTLFIPAFCFVSVISARADETTESVEEKNKAVVERWNEEVWQKNNVSFINDITTKDYNRKRAIAFAQNLHVSYPDLFVEVVEMLAEDDKVALAWKLTGTSANQESMGKEISFTGVTILRLENGKIAETTGYWNWLNALRQLGHTVVPPLAEDAKVVTIDNMIKGQPISSAEADHMNEEFDGYIGVRLHFPAKQDDHTFVIG